MFCSHKGTMTFFIAESDSLDSVPTTGAKADNARLPASAQLIDYHVGFAPDAIRSVGFTDFRLMSAESGKKGKIYSSTFSLSSTRGTTIRRAAG